MNRFVAQSNQTRSQTWHVLDRRTGRKVIDHTFPDDARAWASQMNADQKAGRKICTPSEDLDP